VVLGRLKFTQQSHSRQVLIRIDSGVGILHCEIHKLITLIRNKEELPHQRKKTIVAPVHKKGDKTDGSKCRDISLL
jgi:hypothetical protein